MTDKATRHPKTPAMRAQETVDILTRRLTKIKAQKAAFELQASDLAIVLVIVQKRLTYAEANPDLPKKQVTAPRPIGSGGAS